MEDADGTAAGCGALEVHAIMGCKAALPGVSLPHMTNVWVSDSDLACDKNSAGTYYLLTPLALDIRASNGPSTELPDVSCRGCCSRCRLLGRLSLLVSPVSDARYWCSGSVTVVARAQTRSSSGTQA
eukprot:3481520-Rhodomonas_salina.1